METPPAAPDDSQSQNTESQTAALIDSFEKPGPSSDGPFDDQDDNEFLTIGWVVCFTLCAHRQTDRQTDQQTTR